MQRALAEVVVAPRALEDGVAVELVAGIRIGVAVALAVQRLVLALAFRVLGFHAQLGCQAVSVVLGVRHHIDVVLAIGAGRQGELGAGGVAGTRGQAGRVAVHDRADGRGAAGDEARVGAEVDRVEPALRPRPHVRAGVLHRPVDGRFFAGEVLGDGADVADAQIGRAVVHHRHRRLDVVGLADLADGIDAGE